MVPLVTHEDNDCQSSGLSPTVSSDHLRLSFASQSRKKMHLTQEIMDMDMVYTGPGGLWTGNNLSMVKMEGREGKGKERRGRRTSDEISFSFLAKNWREVERPFGRVGQPWFTVSRHNLRHYLGEHFCVNLLSFFGSFGPIIQRKKRRK